MSGTIHIREASNMPDLVCKDKEGFIKEASQCRIITALDDILKLVNEYFEGEWKILFVNNDVIRFERVDWDSEEKGRWCFDVLVYLEEIDFGL